MDEHQPGLTRSREGLAALLTPKASAISGFTFAVLAMTGQGTWTQAIQALWLPNFPQSQLSSVFASGLAASLVLAVAAFLLGRRALAASTAPEAWEAHLGRAAMLVAGVAGLLALLGIVLHLVGSAAGY